MAKACSLEASKRKASGMEKKLPAKKLILFHRDSCQRLIDGWKIQHRQIPRRVGSVDWRGHTVQSHVLQKDNYATNVANKTISPECALQKYHNNNHMLTKWLQNQ